MKALFISICLSLSALAAYGETYEIKEMRQILPAIQEHSLVILDLDNTVLRPVQTLGSDQWYGYEVERQKKSGKSEEEAIRAAIDIWMSVQTRSQMRAVERSTPKRIRALQANGLRVMALTARPVALAHVTERQLHSLNVDFTKSPVLTENTQVANDPSAQYLNGTLYVGPLHNKGQILRQFLVENRIPVSHIVFVDDKSKHVNNVEKALLDSGIQYQGFRYGAADAWVQSFDANIADRQRAIFDKTGRLISDEEARRSRARL